MNQKLKILLVDDHTILLDGLKNILLKSGLAASIETATDGVVALEKLKMSKADLVITDLNMPNMDGLEFIKEVRSNFPPTKIIVLSLHDEPHYIRNVMKHRVQGYILKNESSTELVLAVERVLDGKTFMSDKINSVLVEQMNKPTAEKLLTDRELQIIKLIAQEFSNKQIANKLFISERTVETHRKNIFRKTETHNLVGLIKFAYSNNLI